MAKLAELLKEMGVIDEVPNPLPVIRSRHFKQKAPYGNSKLLPSSYTSFREDWKLSMPLKCPLYDKCLHRNSKNPSNPPNTCIFCLLFP
jgi:hypothetical protein